MEAPRLKKVSVKPTMSRPSRKPGFYLVEVNCLKCNTKSYPCVYSGRPSEFIFQSCVGCGDGVYESTFVSLLMQIELFSWISFEFFTILIRENYIYSRSIHNQRYRGRFNYEFSNDEGKGVSIKTIDFPTILFNIEEIELFYPIP